jgi:hypothetical protein
MKNQKIALASILIVATGLLALHSSPMTNVQAQYYDDQYAYDKGYPDPKTGSDVNIQKIKCVNSNVNINGIEVNQIPPEPAVANEIQGTEEAGANGAIGNGLGNINFDKNLVNICVNLNFNEQQEGFAR